MTDHEAVPGLPHTLERFLIEVAAATEGGRPGGPLTYEFADRIGALHHCDVCGRPIVDIAAATDWLLEAYGEPESRGGDVEEAVRRSGLEVGDPLSPNYCSYHAEITSE